METEKLSITLMLVSLRFIAITLTVWGVATFLPEVYPMVKEIASVALGILGAAFLSGLFIYLLDGER